MSGRQRKALAPNLFPFLAVLVCTLGTLILLLALVAEKAETAAQQIADSQAESANLQTEEERWRAEELRKLRARQTAELEQRRSELAHLEDHLRRLRDELAQLSREAEAAETQADGSSAKQTEIELVALRTQIDRAKKEIGDLGRQREGRKPRVVIVPYQGSNGTERRPIYVECTDQAVIIQPEGVQITADQLEGPLGPGNPLDAALRAVRAHWQQTEAEPQPPYPLLLVRPGGVHAYAACRSAMAAWDDQFGYELIPADLPLAFPKADDRLRGKLVATISDAVERQRSKIAAMPRRYSELGRRTAAAGESFGGGDAAALYARTASTDFAPNGSSDAGSSAFATSIEGHRDRVGRDGAGGGSGSTGDSLSGDRGSAGDESGTGDVARADAGASDGDRQADGDGRFGTDGKAGSEDRTGSDGESGGKVEADGDVEADGEGGDGSEGGGEHSNPLEGGGGRQTQGQIAGSPGSASFSAPPQSGASAAAAGGAPPSGLTSSMQSSPPPDPHAKTFSDAVPPPSQPPSRADRREAAAPGDRPVLRAGNDWALPTSNRRRGTAIVRQMRLRCEAERFVLLPESHRSAVLVVVALRDGAVEPAVMELATALRGRIESWGMAMQNGRWEPVLSVTVAADAESRFVELQKLLRGSGIRVEREASR